MSLRKKIFVIVIPVMLVSVGLINLIFGAFFNNYLEDQEDMQIESISGNIDSYVKDNLTRYQGNANDWGHWDDTYDFLRGNNADYVHLNLIWETFDNLDVNFIIYLNGDGSVYYQRYYDFESGEFKDFSPKFFEDFNGVLDSVNSAEDTSAVYGLNGSYYFLAATDVTDSLESEGPAGRMITGRIIDGGIMADIEKLAGASLVSIKTPSISAGDINTVRQVSQDKHNINFDCVISDASQSGTFLKFTFDKQRDMYIAGMGEFNNFIIMSIIFSLLFALILFTLLGVYHSKPFVRLIRDVRNIDVKAVRSVPVSGRGDFSYLRRTINRLLSLIEEEKGKAKENEEKLYATLTAVGDGVIVVGRDGRVQFINPVAQKLTGWSVNEVLGMQFNEIFRIINEYTREKVESPVSKVFATETIIELENHTVLIAKDGTERPIEDTAAPVRDKQGNVVSCVLVFRDFSDKKERQKRIEYLSYHDQLTGLYNRRFFEEELKRLDTEKNLPITLVYADVNGLKTINDAFGHDSGDAMIQQAAEVFTEVCKDGVIARTGGDEFIILLTRTNGDMAERLVNDIKDRLEDRKIMGVNMSLSFGWKTKSASGQSVWEALKDAENSMYRNKLISSNHKRSAIIDSILGTLHLKCPREEDHSERVSMLCEQMGRILGMNETEVSELKAAGELHDIGKIAVDGSVLNKKEGLSESEWVQIKNHPEVGYRILSTAREFYNIAEYVLEHHERWDGKGYPKGLSGVNINLKARIIAIADAYDVMTCERPYKEELSRSEALRELRRNAGTQFDPKIARIFVEQVLNENFDADEEEASQNREAERSILRGCSG